jgi:uncharacterized cupin superfamily protein
MVAVEEGTSRTSVDPDSPERFVSLRRALGVTAFGINQLVLQPGQQMRIHRHGRQEEVYLVLEGRLSVYVERDENVLEPGDLMRVAPGVRRQLVNLGPSRVVLVAVGGGGEHESRDGEAYTSWEDANSAHPRDVPFPDDLPADKLRS